MNVGDNSAEEAAIVTASNVENAEDVENSEDFDLDGFAPQRDAIED